MLTNTKNYDTIITMNPLKLYTSYLKSRCSEIRNHVYYATSVKNYLIWLNSKGVAYNQVSYNLLTEYFEHLLKTVIPATANNYIKAIKHFYNYLNMPDVGLVSDNIMFNINKLKYFAEENKSASYDWLDSQELENMIELVIWDEPIIYQLKIEALLRLMYCSGLRRQEVLSLKRVDFDFEGTKLLVTTPKEVNGVRTQRAALFPKSIHECVKKYFDADPENKNAFNMSIKLMNKLFKELRELVKGKDLSPHTMRRSFANSLHREHKMSIRDIQNLMGHSNMETTLRYVNPNIDESIEAFNKIAEEKERRKNVRKQKGNK